MNKLKTTNQIAKIIAVSLLINLSLISFVFAQAPGATPPADKDAVLNKANFQKAQTDPNYCLKDIKNAVFNISERSYKTITPMVSNGRALVPKGCSIVPVDFNDKASLSDVNSRPIGATFLENKIKASDTGINADTATQAKQQDDIKEAGWISKFAGYLVTWAADLVTALLSFLTAIAGGIYGKIVNDTIAINIMPVIVNVGWTIVRDICNMFFILILIVIAIGTILQLEEYNYKHLLGEVVIMAILVNFSKVIAVTLIDATNMLTLIFVSDAGLVNTAKTMWNIIHPGDLVFYSNNAGFGAGISGALVAGLSKMILSLVMFSAYLALAGLFLVRLVGLYVLVILSPVAYALDIIPATKHFAHEWWGSFVKYLIWAPVAAFFVRLVDILAASGGLSGTTAGEGNSVFTFIILAALMWAAVIVAEHAGMVGGNAVIQAAEKLGEGIAHRGLHYAGRKWNEFTTHTFLEGHEGSQPGAVKKTLFALLNPVAAAKGYEQRGHELTHAAQELAAAGGREVVEQFQTGGWRGKAKLKIPYRQFVERKEEDAFLKDYGQMKKETLMQAAVDAEGMDSHTVEGGARKRAILKAAAANGYMDDLMRMKPFANKYAGSDNVVYSAESLNRFMYGYLGNGEQAMRFMGEDMEELGKKVKHFEYLGHAYYDPTAKAWKRGMETEKDAAGQTVYEDVNRGAETFQVEKIKPLTKDTWQVKYSVGEFSKLGGRDRVNAAPHNFTVIRDDVNGDGSFKENQLDESLHFGREHGEFDSFNQEMLKKMDADVMREVQHAQARVKKWILSETLVPGSHGAIVLDDPEHIDELTTLYKIQPEFAKGLYTKVLKVKGDAREKIDGIRYVLKSEVVTDADGNVTGLIPGATVRQVGTPTFDYTEDPPEVKKP
jgi:hypothetical protein